MKQLSKITEEHSLRIFWVIQTIFGFLIARSLYSYSSVFIPTTIHYDLVTMSIAFMSVYICVLWSWIDFSYTLIVSPYQFRDSFVEKLRFLSDLFIVLMYSFLLSYLDHIKENSHDKIIQFFIAFTLIYFGYFISGLLRIVQYGQRASRIIIITIFTCLFLLLAILYAKSFAIYGLENSLLLNRSFIAFTIALTIIYRIVRSIVSKRKNTIAVDVDGVLANQIENILPQINNKYGTNLTYNDVKKWDLEIVDTGIDKIIVEEMNQKSYIMKMPLHHGANKVIRKLIRKHYISIATARPASSDVWTKEWLSQNKISYDTYYNLKESGKQNANEDFDILIDDYIGNIIPFLEKHHGKAILYSQPWNEDRNQLNEYITSGRLIIVSSWAEVEKAVNELMNNK